MGGRSGWQVRGDRSASGISDAIEAVVAQGAMRRAESVTERRDPSITAVFSLYSAARL
jgi:hypothetical protein